MHKGLLGNGECLLHLSVGPWVEGIQIMVSGPALGGGCLDFVREKVGGGWHILRAKTFLG